MTDLKPGHPRWLVPALAGAVLAPLVVAAVAQRNGQWHPVFDLAMTELRVRDVGGAHTPLIGLQGRIGPTGSHPGPLSFYLLAPTYRALGSSAFALQAASAAFHALAAVVSLVIVARRRDPRATVAVAVLLLLLMQGYGLGPLTEPWNPHLPVLWFLAFLVACWAVVDRDHAMLVPAVGAGSICAQTHVPYLPVTLGIGAAVAALLVWRALAEPRGRGDWRWLAAAAATALILWTPPLVDEAIHEPGNLTQLVDHLGSPAEEPIGIERAATLVLERLDGWHLLVVERAHPGTYVRILEGPGPRRARGAITLAVWVACIAGSLAMRHRRLLHLHALVGVATLVSLVAISRIYGIPWTYLLLWGYSVGAMMVVSIIATAVVGVGRRWPAVGRSSLVPGVGLLVVAALAVQLAVLAPDATTGTPADTAQLGRLVPDTVRGIDAGEGAATGHRGRYDVRWYDATLGGAEGLGLVNELVRRGYEVGVAPDERVRVPAHRSRPAGWATARIVLASGGWIDHWAAQPGAVLLTQDDPRTAAERREFAATRQAAIDALTAAGRLDLVPRIDTDLFGVALNERVGGDAQVFISRMLDIGVAAAVFIVPPEVDR